MYPQNLWLDDEDDKNLCLSHQNLWLADVVHIEIYAVHTKNYGSEMTFRATRQSHGSRRALEVRW